MPELSNGPIVDQWTASSSTPNGMTTPSTPGLGGPGLGGKFLLILNRTYVRTVHPLFDSGNIQTYIFLNDI